MNKQYIEQATIEHCKANKIKLIRFTQVFFRPLSANARTKRIASGRKDYGALGNILIAHRHLLVFILRKSEAAISIVAAFLFN